MQWGNSIRKLTDKCYWSRPSGTKPWAVCDYKSKTGCNPLQEIVDKDPTRPLKLPHGGAVVFGKISRPRKRCRPSKAYDPEKSVVVSEEDDKHLNPTTTSRPAQPGSTG